MENSSNMKLCSKCKKLKSEIEFRKEYSKKNRKWYFRQPCKSCFKAEWKIRNKIHYWANREEELKKVKTYRQAHRDEISIREKAWYQKNRERFLEKQNLYYRCNINERKSYEKFKGYMLKLEILGHYSDYTYRCKICGETRDECLSIDHTEGGGSKHRRELRKIKVYSGYGFYKWLQKQGYPKGYRVLCMNCQFVERSRLKNDLY